MLRILCLCVLLVGASGCPSSAPTSRVEPKSESKNDAAQAGEAAKAQDEAKSEESSRSAGAEPEAGAPEKGGSVGPSLAAQLNSSGCTKPTLGKPVAYRLSAYGANAAASLDLRVTLDTHIMTGNGFRVDAAGMIPETVNHDIAPDKISPFTVKLDALCLDFAPIDPDLPAAPSGYTRYGVEFADGSVRWMSDSTPGLDAGVIFGRVERAKWLDLNKDWPKYQDAKALNP